jgi:hypothetical protein
MSKTSSFWHGLQAATAAALVMCLAPACKPKALSRGPARLAATKTNLLASATNPLAARYVSVFENIIPPKGRDPFFPNSHRRDPVPIMPVVQTEKPPPSSELLLKGIVGAANHRLAVINNAILEKGESGSVRVPSGRVRVKCMEIGEDFAVIQVEGEIEPKRLRLSKKGN